MSRVEYYERAFGKPDKLFTEDGFVQMVWIYEADVRRIIINDFGTVQKAPFKDEADSFKNKGLCYPTRY